MTLRVRDSTKRNASEPEPRIWAVALISAGLGGLLGLFVYPTPQHTVEIAQVLGGVVDLPADNPMRIFDTAAYSLSSIQIPALLLTVGLSESTLSLLLSSLQAAVAFSAVALVSLAISRSEPVALLTPIVLLNLVSFPLLGHKYPVSFPNTEYNAHLLGFFGVLGAISLIALERERIGSFLLGALPAMMPILGVAGWIAAGTALLVERRCYPGLLHRTWPYFVAGAALFALTFAFQMLVIREVPSGVDFEAARGLVADFMRFEDGHRMPYFETGQSTPWEFFEVDVALVLLTILLLTTFRRSVPSSARLLLIGLLAITTVASSFTVVDEISPDLFPVFVKGLMITRWLNWNSIVFPVLVISLLGYFAVKRRSVVALLALGLLALPPRRELIAAGLGTLLAYALIPTIRPAIQRVIGASYPPAASGAVSVGAIVAIATLFSALMLDARDFDLDEGNPVWREARKTDGLMVLPPAVVDGSGRVTSAQLRTERGVLFDPALLNTVTYVPAAAPGAERILNEVYGTSIRNAKTQDYLWEQTEQLWRDRTTGDWEALGSRYGTTNVLAESGWDLQLPRIASGGSVDLYRIPAASEAGGRR